jgi:hypothetical protein
LVAAIVSAAGQSANAAALVLDLDYQNTTYTASQAGFLGLKGSLTANFSIPTGHDRYGNTTYSTRSTTTVGSFGWNVNASTVSGSDTTDASFDGKTLQTFCIQAFQNFSTSSDSIDFVEDYIKFNQSATLPVGGSDQGYLDLTAAKQIQSLINNHWTEVFNDTSGIKAAAFQLAVWEVVYDGGGDSKGGGDTFGTNHSSDYYFHSSTDRDFTVTSKDSNGAAAIGYAASWLNSISIVGLDLNAGTLALTNAYKQDQITYIPTSGSTPPPGTPLPASLPMGLSAMAALAAYRKFRRKS